MHIGISNSEVAEWNKCQASWLRKYHPGSLLAKKNFGVARTRGIIAHKSLETFYGAIKIGANYDMAVEMAMWEIRKERFAADEMSDMDKVEMLSRLIDIMAKYYDYYRADVENWEIISTENFHAMEAGPEDDFYLPMRLDMVIYQRRGEYAGEISPVDHKTTNDPWTRVMIGLDAQLPLYIRALRENGFKGHPKPVVKRGIYNFIRTRDVRDPAPASIFDREFVPATRERIEKTYRNHLNIARDIMRLKRLSFDEALDRIKYQYNKQACRYCDFASICLVTINGDDPTTTLVADYGPSTYGYAPLETLDGGQ